ncbi:hypothetical protein AO384_1836 [Moraxella catarrhalis]|uniref:Uncharacterized protein n=1 Tax=Moraxella catarrhalis TaxID=480 RepID=A0A198UDL5_MORCA|nr:hypothetical protein AO384_1836 [Moraxella catarrhalis]OAU99456.1 hypothetical protein AO383_0222 [Moraxella catarrhalis]OAV02067.1 hypothetical protein AO382_0433 [Moraxella catarrhalis]
MALMIPIPFFTRQRNDAKGFEIFFSDYSDKCCNSQSIYLFIHNKNIPINYKNINPKNSAHPLGSSLVHRVQNGFFML